MVIISYDVWLVTVIYPYLYWFVLSLNVSFLCVCVYVVHSLETNPQFLFMLLVGGLQYPVSACCWS